MNRARESRTAAQILRSTIAYLEWRAGERWRRRFDPERVDYVAAIRVVLTAQHAPQADPKLPPLLPTSPSPSKQVKQLAGRPRAWLVDRLLLANPQYTDRKLLTHLDRLKLATMLAGARAEARRTA